MIDGRPLGGIVIDDLAQRLMHGRFRVVKREVVDQLHLRVTEKVLGRGL